MNVLVVGKGGREHALCWLLSRSASVARLLCAPGREGFLRSARCALAGGGRDVEALAAAEKIDLVVVGPEAPLVEGLADRLRARGVAVFGPGREGARLEGSKRFAKDFMTRHRVPTARFRAARDEAQARAAIDELGGACVVKADGLMAGKGVVVCGDAAEARAAARALLASGAGREGLVVEELLAGEEASVIALVDGKDYRLLPAAQDHKRIGDGDTGPNTGGMGAYCPAARLVTPGVARRIEREVVVPVVAGLRRDRVDFRGALYCGLMIAPSGEPRVLEFNVRFGDPETQPQMMMVGEDLGALLWAAARGELGPGSVAVREGAAACVVVAAEGYPGEPAAGDAIEGLDDIAEDDDHAVFHAGTARDGRGRWTADGGRVLGVTARGENLAAAVREAYAMVAHVRMRGMHYRRDIGAKGM